MLDYFRFLFWGIFFIAPAEYIINTMIVPGASFTGAIILYALLLTIYYLLHRKSFMRYESKKEKFIESLILGSFGLFVMEWAIIGNSPSGNPEAIQSSMFIWWIWVFLFPKVMVSDKSRSLRKSILSYQIVYSIAFWVFMIIVGNPLAFVFVYAYGLWIFYYLSYRYIRFDEGGSEFSTKKIITN